MTNSFFLFEEYYDTLKYRITSHPTQPSFIKIKHRWVWVLEPFCFIMVYN